MNLLSVITLCVVSVTWTNAVRCPSGMEWNAEHETCYVYVETAANRYAAKATCECMNGHLVEILSSEKQQFVEEVAAEGGTWLGATRTDGGAVNDIFWETSGSKVDEGYTNYSNSDPDGKTNILTIPDCVIIYNADSDYKWYDTSCLKENYFICEAEQVCPDGMEKNTEHNICYSYETTAVNWDAATDVCAALDTNAHPVEIHSAEKQQFVENVAAETGTWLGATRTDGGAVNDIFWETSGSKVVEGYTNYGNNQPDGKTNVLTIPDCLIIYDADSDYKWYDTSCLKENAVLCEYDL